MQLNDRFPISDDTHPSETLSCCTCGALVLAENAETHNEWHKQHEE